MEEDDVKADELLAPMRQMSGLDEVNKIKLLHNRTAISIVIKYHLITTPINRYTLLSIRCLSFAINSDSSLA